jgi:hypothetical protein
MSDEIDATIDKLHAAGATDDEITAIIKEKYGPQSDSSGVGFAAAGAGVPAAASGLASFAASPAVPKAFGAVARGATTVGGLLHGAYTGNFPEIVASPIAGWQAGKGGYFLGKMAQSIAKPASGLLQSVAPYAQTLSTLGGVQGGLDLAQMADPNRKDIGFLGMGPSVNVPGAEPPVLNRLAAYIRGKIGG